MGNLCSRGFTDCFYKKETILKETLLGMDSINKEFCGYPFCNTIISRKNDKDELIAFRNTVYCTEKCLKLHKKNRYLGLGWSN